MSERKQKPIKISIDLKKYRLRIHKTTLGLLGIPKYVQLLVNPVNMQVAIRGIDNKLLDAHRVNLSAIQSDNSYELYSKSFIQQLCILVPELDFNCTYRLIGQIIESENIALFSLKTLKKVEAMEDNHEHEIVENR